MQKKTIAGKNTTHTILEKWGVLHVSWRQSWKLRHQESDQEFARCSNK